MLSTIEMLAQVGPAETWLAPLGGVGIAGVMLHWFMIRNERRMIAVENASNRTTRAILLLVMSMNQHASGVAAREEAKSIGKEIDDSERRPSERAG